MNFEQATDEILTILKDAWDETGYPMYHEDLQTVRETSNSPWATSVIRHASSRQATLGGIGQRSFLRVGVLIVSVFIQRGNGLSEAYQLAKLVAEAFEGKSSPNGVWFRNVRVNEIGPDGTFFQTNILIDFEYHETK